MPHCCSRSNGRCHRLPPIERRALRDRGDKLAKVLRAPQWGIDSPDCGLWLLWQLWLPLALNWHQRVIAPIGPSSRAF